MAPALLVDVSLEAIRQTRGGAVVPHVTGRAGHAGTAAIAAVRAVPRSQGMVFADPADVRTEDAFHALVFAFPLIDRPSRRARLRIASGLLPVFFTMPARSSFFASSISSRWAAYERPGRFGLTAIIPWAPAGVS
jgi:hypothetical protein